MSLGRIFLRSSILCFTTLSFPSTKRSFATSNPFLTSKGRLTKNRVGILLTRRSSMSSSASPALPVPQVERLLEGTYDRYGGVIVEMTSEPLDPVVFASLLKASLSHWRQQGKKGIWIKMPIELVNLVEPAVKEGFYFHHAEPNYLMLVHWLPATANTLPANASHRVGIGAFVLNEKNEVLVVQEKSGHFRGTGIWKFPTGVVDEGEDICDAAVREVKEETGIDSKFLEILAFRQSHQSFFEKSDLFFVCMLQPLSVDIKPQEAEIEAAQWMPYEEYVGQPFIQKHDLLVKIAKICAAKKDGNYSGFQPLPSTTGFSHNNGFLAFTATELKKKLKEKRFPVEAIDPVITNFQSRGLINDGLYAETYSQSRWSSSSWGPRRIKQGLSEKGIKKADAEKAIKIVFKNGEGGEDEDSITSISKQFMDQLYIRASKQWQKSHGASKEIQKSRMVRWLQYRGFNWDVIKYVLMKLESGIEYEGADKVIKPVSKNGEIEPLNHAISSISYHKS